jgi:hypothetical protein
VQQREQCSRPAIRENLHGVTPVAALLHRMLQAWELAER